MLALNPADVRVLSVGSNALFADGQHVRAMEWSQRALELNPDDTSALICGACLRIRLGLREQALVLLERVFEHGRGKRDWIENDPNCAISLGVVKLDERKYEQSEVYLKTARDGDPQAERAPSKSACLDHAEQLGDRSARDLGLTRVGVDLGKDRQAKRLEHFHPDLAGELHRLVAQLRGRVPCARRHLRLGVEEQAPGNVGIGPLSGLRGQRSPQSARLVVAVGSAQQERERDARRRQAHRQSDMPGPPAGGPVAVAIEGLLELQRTVEEVMLDTTRAREPDLCDRR